MNLYDLSIGEGKMNQFLSIALKTHFESLKVGGKGENYWQCYQAFLKYYIYMEIVILRIYSITNY